MIGLHSTSSGLGHAAVLVLACSLLTTGCAEGQDSDTTLATPMGNLSSSCSGVPMVHSRNHGLVAFGCDDGSMPVVSFNKPPRRISDAFALDVMSISDTDNSLTALAFRPAQDDGEPASVLRIDLLSGTLSRRAIDGSTDVDSLEVSPDGHCLMAARSDHAVVPHYAITAHDLRPRRDIAEALNATPSIRVEVTGNEASTVGHLNLGFSRCVIDAEGRIALLLTRLRPLGPEGVESTLELHVAGSEPKRLFQAHTQWRLLWRNAGNNIALIDGLTGRLGLIDLSNNLQGPHWVDQEGHWIDYDPMDGAGVILRHAGQQTGAIIARRGSLVRVRCSTNIVIPVCRDEEVISSSATEVYPSGVGAPGAGVVLQYTEVTITPGSTLYTPRQRWLF